MNVFASIQLSEGDKKALIILLILLIILVLIIGLIGMAIRATMKYQAKRADTMMHDVAVTRVIDTPAKFRHFGMKKNNRALFRDSLKPFLLVIAAVIIWTIFNIVVNQWTRNIFDDWDALFVHMKWSNDQYPPDDPLFVKVFGIYLFARWPEADPVYPRFDSALIPNYIVVAMLIVALVWYLVLCQAWISRFFMIRRRANSVYEKSLEGFRAAEDIHVKPENPLPPSE